MEYKKKKTRIKCYCKKKISTSSLIFSHFIHYKGKKNADYFNKIHVHNLYKSEP